MNMTVTYKYKNLGELAAYFESKALELRGRANEKNPKGPIGRSLRAEASAYESAAYILRNTVIEP